MFFLIVSWTLILSSFVLESAHALPTASSSVHTADKELMRVQSLPQTFKEVIIDGKVLRIYDEPALQSANPAVAVKKDLNRLEKRNGYCGGSTFKSDTGWYQAVSSDCATLSLLLKSRSSKTKVCGWGSPDAPWFIIYEHKSCRFIAWAVNVPCMYIGNTDGYELIRDSVAHYTYKSGLLATEGKMQCQADFYGQSEFYWGITRS